MSHKVKVNKVSDTEVEIEGEIEATHFAGHRKGALANLGKNAELPGFRKGMVPEEILAERLGHGPILEEMAELALSEAYPKIIEEHKIDAVDRPHIQITKLAMDNPLTFKIRQTVLPDIKLPDYKKLAAGVLAREDREKRWIGIAEALLEHTTVPVPPILVERQVEQFLAHMKKEGPDARAAIRPEAEKYVRIQLILSSIAKKEGVEIPAVVEMLENVK
ncbi:MAG TPA: trigger factor [Candidatus Paceibacterota bacterium]